MTKAERQQTPKRSIGRPVKVDANGVATVDRIVDCALELFLEHGYHSTSVQNIVDAAEVTKGAFYHHFDSKDDLISRSHEAYLEEELSILRAARAKYERAEDQLEAHVGQVLEGVIANRARVAMFLEERRILVGDRLSAALRLRRQYEREVREIIEDGVERGEFSPEISPEIATLGIFGMLSWTYQWLELHGRPGAEETARGFVRILKTGLLASGPPEDD